MFYHFRAFTEPYLPAFVTRTFASGYLAVDLFFMLSGFVLFYCHGHEFEAVRSSTVLTFYKKRLARVYPVHLLLLLLFLSVPSTILLFSEQATVTNRFTSGSFIANLLLIQNWGLFDQLTWNIPAWSISVEWFAYLWFPAIAFAISKFRDAKAVLIGLILISLLLVPLTGNLFGIASIGDNISNYGVIRGLIQFIVGALLCPLALSRRDANLYVPTFVAIIPFGLLILLSAGIVSDLWFAPLTFLVLILYLSGGRGFVARAFKSRWLVFLGDISYSTYIIHYLVYDWFKFLFIKPGEPAAWWLIVLTFGFILVASILSYRWIERPAQRALLSLTIANRV